jgi:hypothetical protein
MRGAITSHRLIAEGARRGRCRGVEPEAVRPIVAGRDELVVVDAGTVGKGDAHVAAFEVSEPLGCDKPTEG